MFDCEKSRIRFAAICPTFFMMIGATVDTPRLRSITFTCVAVIRVISAFIIDIPAFNHVGDIRSTTTTTDTTTDTTDHVATSATLFMPWIGF